MEQIFQKIQSTDLRSIREIVFERLRKAIMNKRRNVAMEEHKALIKAFEKRDEILAEQIGREHTINAKDFLSKEIHLF